MQFKYMTKKVKKTKEPSGCLAILAGIFLCWLFFLLGIAFLWQNEEKAYFRAKGLDSSEGLVVKTKEMLPQHEGKLVYTNGIIQASTSPVDEMYNVAPENALRLFRHVDMYQWKEHIKIEEKDYPDGSTVETKTVTYDQEWAGYHIDSSEFDKRYRQTHRNPKTKEPLEIFYATNARLNGYKVSKEMINNLSSKPIDLPADLVIPDKLKALSVVHEKEIFISRTGKTTLSSPKIGDYKIYFTYTPVCELTVMAKQQGGGFTEYDIENGEKLMTVRKGKVAADSLFEQEKSNTQLGTWFVRVLGCFFLFWGFFFGYGVIGYFAEKLKVADTLIEALSPQAVLLSWSLFSLMVIATAWLTFNTNI